MEKDKGNRRCWRKRDAANWRRLSKALGCATKGRQKRALGNPLGRT